jgi:hypothetical protein
VSAIPDRAHGLPRADPAVIEKYLDRAWILSDTHFWHDNIVSCHLRISGVSDHPLRLNPTTCFGGIRVGGLARRRSDCRSTGQQALRRGLRARLARCRREPVSARKLATGDPGTRQCSWWSGSAELPSEPAGSCRMTIMDPARWRAHAGEARVDHELGPWQGLVGMEWWAESLGAKRSCHRGGHWQLPRQALASQSPEPLIASQLRPHQTRCPHPLTSRTSPVAARASAGTRRGHSLRHPYQ